VARRHFDTRAIGVNGGTGSQDDVISQAGVAVLKKIPSD
jgi:uncharacterized protein GlcG (DUF336 family)